MARMRLDPPKVTAYFIDGPLAGETRQIDPAPDGNPRAWVTLPDVDGLTYERADFGDLRSAVRYRLRLAD